MNYEVLVDIGKPFMVLFAVIDIFGSIPVIIKIKKRAGDIHVMKASLVALGIMLAFLFIGEGILSFLGVEIKAFAVVGSLIIFALGVEMIFGVQLFRDEDEGSKKIVSIVPIAFPLIAGAGTMTTIVSLQAEYEMQYIAIAIVLNMIVVFFVLKLTKRIERFLGKGGIAILQKVFGIILLSIAVKLFADNVKDLFL
ncbi:MAG: MarC family protein [Crocinitomix sp.]|nr:MarC family protein [Crocinitomix sp.]